LKSAWGIFELTRPQPRRPAPPAPRPAEAPSAESGHAAAVSPRLREIYLHASRLFVEKGYAATSMSDIARAVRMTKAGLYHFVKGKEDLLFTIMNFGMDELAAEVIGPARAIEDPLERVTFIIRRHLLNIWRIADEHGNPVTIVAVEPFGLSPDNRRAIQIRQREYLDLVKGCLDELKARGDLADSVDVTVSAYNILGMILWTARWRRRSGRLSTDEIIDEMTRQILRGLVTPETINRD
jgi:AcrR family transcriptional regulator